MDLLERKSPGITEQLGRLSSEQLRKVVARVSEWASHSIDDLEPSIRALPAVASEKNAFSAQQVAEANKYAETTDDRYLTLQDDYEWKSNQS